MTTARVRPASGLKLREKPNGRVIDVLRKDEEVDVLEKVTFYRVKTDDGANGYVHGDFVEEYPSEPKTVSLAVPSDEFFPSPEFELVQFNGKHFIGDKVMVDKDFTEALTRVDHYAERCQLEVWVTSSTRNLNEQVRGAIVPPASKSCHHIGHAIDMNLRYDGVLYNSKKLKKSELGKQPASIGKFIDLLREDKELRWGGDFNQEDPVHIDDDFYRKQETMYLAKLQSRVAQLNA